MGEFKDREAERVKKKAEDLAPFVEAAFKRTRVVYNRCRGEHRDVTSGWDWKSPRPGLYLANDGQQRFKRISGVRCNER